MIVLLLGWHLALLGVTTIALGMLGDSIPDATVGLALLLAGLLLNLAYRNACVSSRSDLALRQNALRRRRRQLIRRLNPSPGIGALPRVTGRPNLRPHQIAPNILVHHDPPLQFVAEVDHHGQDFARFQKHYLIVHVVHICQIKTLFIPFRPIREI